MNMLSSRYKVNTTGFNVEKIPTLSEIYYAITNGRANRKAIVNSYQTEQLEENIMRRTEKM